MSKKKPSDNSRTSQLKKIYPFLDELGIDECDIDFSVPPPTDLDRAQEFIYEAWEAQTYNERIALARKALTLSSNCADAYNLLAEEEAQTLKQQLEYYREGVQAGERALGKEFFKEEVGYFWGLLSTRPYMRARAGLAKTLWELGNKEEAVEHYDDMLRLNPNDNQGIRYILLPFLIELGRTKDAEKLYNEYKEDSMACWPYSRTLLDFIAHGNSTLTTQSLQRAIKTNRHIPEYLLGYKEMPEDVQDYYSLGNDSEALAYVECGMSAWESTPDALKWLASKIEGPKKTAST